MASDDLENQKELERKRILEEIRRRAEEADGIEEYSQRFFSTRTFSLLDLIFSYLGVIFFSWVAMKKSGAG